VLTAEQLRHDADLQCVLVAGVPTTTTTGKPGPIALLARRTVAACIVKSAARVKIAVFRTPPAERSLLSKLDGVTPKVDLLSKLTGVVEPSESNGCSAPSLDGACQWRASPRPFGRGSGPPPLLAVRCANLSRASSCSAKGSMRV
jgi:hypothetical protein